MSGLRGEKANPPDDFAPPAPDDEPRRFTRKIDCGDSADEKTASQGASSSRAPRGDDARRNPRRPSERGRVGPSPS